jgi:hypothetical protein
MSPAQDKTVVLDERAWRVLRAAAEAMVPESASLDARGWEEFERLIGAALAERPETLRRRLQLFLRVIEWLPAARHGRKFSSLDATRRERFLAALENSGLLLVRNGFWGLRALVFLGYYGQPEITREIGYAAHPRGWGARR